ncbi:hypothetical protein Mal52_55970 [Symmachiella dynata]|uniref:Carboxypeptidase regulatory-like domain-containing protein n=1 Tax=Symmachiella dynata TaxID=2527995 RepID=A0A517ZX46_9PLAN|nr:carboxypeptidase-like regulatory domain-containing protein [Symmachiella dynata]QDU47069.1 hypothetical protein Mal52_55970 [Symmachiella dynata]
MNAARIQTKLVLISFVSCAITMATSSASADEPSTSPQIFLAKEEKNPEAQIKLSGLVRTADRKPVPVGTRLKYCSIYTFRRKGTTGITQAMWGNLGWRLGPNGRFSGAPFYGHAEGDTLTRVKYYLTASAPGYAPSWIGPLKAKPGDSLDDLDIVLKLGFEGRLKLTDSDGKPIVGVNLEMSYAGKQCPLLGKLKSGDDGMVIIPDCAQASIDVSIRHPGFQPSRFKVLLSPNKDLQHELLSARPTTGLVVSSETGEPIPGAKIQILEEQFVYPVLFGLSHVTCPHEYHFGDGPIVGSSDQQGRFTIDTFIDDLDYKLAVIAPGYKNGRLIKIQSGQKDLRVELELAPEEESSNNGL